MVFNIVLFLLFIEAAVKKLLYSLLFQHHSALIKSFFRKFWN